MPRFRVYLKPFNEEGNYVDDYIEVTDDVIKLGKIEVAIDNDEYNVGVVRNTPIELILRNDYGLYDLNNTLRTIFRTKVKNTLVRITWDVVDQPLICGFFLPGTTPLGNEVEVFNGVINDLSSDSDIDKQIVKLRVMSKDNIIGDIETPYSSITNGDNLSDILYTVLNQPPFNQLVTVDASNINVGQDTTIDDKSSWESTTVDEILRDILLATNSVLYIKNDIVYVSDRTPGVSLAYTFYGQASDQGIENILHIGKIKNGLNRMFNFWTWQDTVLVSKDDTSIDLYGVRKKIMDLGVINTSSTSKINTILDANRVEFATPVMEFDLETPINYDRLELDLLDKIAIDYPTVHVPFDNNPLPRYDLGDVYDGTARYPYSQWSLTIDDQRRFKIINKTIDVDKQILVFKMREIPA